MIPTPLGCKCFMDTTLTRIGATRFTMTMVITATDTRVTHSASAMVLHTLA